MTNEPSSSTRPVAISFQEFRDEEIVDFFANENRTFHPDQAGGNFGRTRLVGAPHFPARQKGTAAFRASIQATERRKNDDRRNGVEREETADTIPLPTEILEASPDVLAATITELPKRRKNPESDPAFNKPARPLGSILGGLRKTGQAASVVENTVTKNEKRNPPIHGRPILVTGLEDTPAPVLPERNAEPPQNESVEQNLLDRLRDTDEQLERLIETWPRLSPRLRETISALVEVAEKDPAE